MLDIDEKSGSEFYFQLYFKSMRKIYAFVMSAVSKPSVADDIVQNVVSSILSNHEQYQPGQDFTEWAISIAQEEILTYMDKSGGIIDDSGKMPQELKKMLFEGDNSFCSNNDIELDITGEDFIIEQIEAGKRSSKQPD